MRKVRRTLIDLMNCRLLIDKILDVEDELIAIDWGRVIDGERRANRYNFLARDTSITTTIQEQ